MPLPDPSLPETGLQEAVEQWKEKGYRVLPVFREPDTSWVQEWAAWNKEVLGAVRTIFGDKEGWAYFGNLFIYSMGRAELKEWQIQDVEAIKAILAKTGEMSFADLGEIHGRIIHLVTPELRTWLTRQAPGVMSILDIIGRIGGVV